jgi:hypothetical protein
MAYPASWNGLSHPGRRSELLGYLEELATPDPRPLWHEERGRGQSSDIDQVFHFFFDDHDFDESAIGYILFDEREVQAVAVVKIALELILADHPDGTDDDFVEHRGWPKVREAAASALMQMQSQKT